MKLGRFIGAVSPSLLNLTTLIYGTDEYTLRRRIERRDGVQQRTEDSFR
jgi:hypothetical protein